MQKKKKDENLLLKEKRKKERRETMNSQTMQISTSTKVLNWVTTQYNLKLKHAKKSWKATEPFALHKMPYGILWNQMVEY